MVLDVAVKFMKPEPKTAKPEAKVNVGLYTYGRSEVHDLYSVHVDSTQILTVSTHEDIIAGKWFTEVLKFTASNTKPLNPNHDFRPDSIFVGLKAETEPRWFPTEDVPYDLLTICVGSHCLMYHLPSRWYRYQTPRLVKDFFANPRVVVFGRDMANVAKKLKKSKIEIRNAVDLNQLAIRGMKRGDLDLGRYDLDSLAMTVLGKHYDFIRPEEKLYEWWSFEKYKPNQKEKVKFDTLDTYLYYLIGTTLMEAIHGARFSGSATTKKKKKKNTKRSQ